MRVDVKTLRAGPDGVYPEGVREVPDEVAKAMLNSGDAVEVATVGPSETATQPKASPKKPPPKRTSPKKKTSPKGDK